jgi:hypothetical protein
LHKTTFLKETLPSIHPNPQSLHDHLVKKSFGKAEIGFLKDLGGFAGLSCFSGTTLSHAWTLA